MKNTIRKLLITLLLIVLTTTTSFSLNTSNTIKTDSIVYITANQLKETNLIFAEHQKLLKENNLLNKQILNYKEDNKLLLQADSIKVVEINLLKDYNNSLTKSIKKQNKSLLIWKIGGITVSSCLLLFLILK